MQLHASQSNRTRCAYRSCVARRSVRAMAAPSGPVIAGPTASSSQQFSDYKRDPELQAALDAYFADTINQGIRRIPHAEIQHHVDRISEVSNRLGLNRVHPEWNNGAFWGRLTTLMNGITHDNVSSMGRLTFNKIHPIGLMVQTDEAEAAGVGQGPDQWKGPAAGIEEDPAHGYTVNTHFKLLDGSGVLGCMRVKALYEADKEDLEKMWVTFTGFSVEPVFRDAQSLALWKAALGEHNPSMDPSTGEIEVVFDKAKRARGSLRYIMMDPEWQMALGGSGALTIMQRVE